MNPPKRRSPKLQAKPAHAGVKSIGERSSTHPVARISTMFVESTPGPMQIDYQILAGIFPKESMG
jgi:hypothetical protein